MTGRTIPCFNQLGTKSQFSPSKPWLFQDFDLLTFYLVTEKELNDKLALFERGEYQWEWEDAEFDMGEHNSLLESTKEEVAEIRKAQAKAQEEMVKAEAESLVRWREEKAKNKVDEGTVDELLTGKYCFQGLHQTHVQSTDNSFLLCTDPAIITIEAPVDANVWKIEVREGEEVGPNKTVAILEAMKLEINVNIAEDQKTAKVEKLLVTAGETVKAGGRIALLRQL